MRTLILDYSVLMHQSWHQMFSPNYQPSLHKFRKTVDGNPDMNTEMEEYFLNLMRNIFYIKCRFNPDEMIFALDAKDNWRKHYIRKYYDSRLNLYLDISGDTKHKTYYSKIDETLWKFEKFYQTMQWSSTKIKGVAKKSVDLSDESRFEKIEQSQIKTLDCWEAVHRFAVPYYKDHRSLSNWKGVTDKNEWKKQSFDKAPIIASILGASVVTVDHAEGDDIIAVAVMMASSIPDDEVIIASVDQDLYQLVTMHPNCFHYNPVKHKLLSISPDEARFKLCCKIAGGDSSDNIEGIMVNGSTLVEVSFTAEGAIKTGKSTVALINSLIKKNADSGITGSKLYRPVYDHLEAVCDEDSFNKNITAIYLKNIPDDLQASITKALNDREFKVPVKKFIDFGVDKQTRISIANKALFDSKEDF